MGAIKELIAAGFDRVLYGLIDSSGYLVGPTATAPAAGNQAGASMGRLGGVQTSDIAINEPETVNVPGDDSSEGLFQFETTELPAFTIDFGRRNLTFEGLSQGTLVHEDGDTAFGVLQPAGPTYPDMCLVFQRQAKSRESGSLGTSRIDGVIVPKAQIIPLGSQNFQGRSAAVFRYRVIANKSDRYPWGLAFGPTNLDTLEGPIIPFSSQYRLDVQRWTGNAIEDEFTLTQTPAGESSAKVRLYVAAIKKVYTTDYTVDAALKKITFVSPPADEAIIIAHLEHL